MSEAYQVPPSEVRVGPYRVVAELARGGMAAVFLAVRADNSGEVVAIKQIHPHLAHDPEFVAMLMDEARIASMIHHPSVIEIRNYQLGEVGAQNFIAMEYAEGETLSLIIRDAIARGIKLDYAMSASIGADVAGGLHAAHELRGPDGALLEIVHRDVSPQNVILTYDGKVKLTDFGIAKAVGRLQRTQPGEIKGKLAYMAPEQAYGRPVDRRSDLYSLGVVLYELALGRRLFGGKTDAETIRNIMQHNIPVPRSIDPGFPAAYEEVLMALLTADPAQRFQSAGALERALRALATSLDPGDIVARRGEFLRSLEPDRYRQKRSILTQEATRARTPTRPAVRPEAAAPVSPRVSEPPPAAPAPTPPPTATAPSRTAPSAPAAPPARPPQSHALDATMEADFATMVREARSQATTPPPPPMVSIPPAPPVPQMLAPSVPAVPAVAAPPPRRRLLWAVIVVATLILLASAAVVLMRLSEPV
ncbi:MAG: serine/threonine-protein kinase [Polyangiales bacterium]